MSMSQEQINVDLFNRCKRLQAENATLRAKAEAYDKGENLWMSFDADTNEPYAVDRDVAVVTYHTWKLLCRHPQGHMPGGFIKKRVRVCEVAAAGENPALATKREREIMRQEIAENIQRDLNFPADQEMAEAIQLLVLHHLNNYAIGRWVSVEERLPEIGKGEWRGYAKFKCGSVDIVTWLQINTLITHWLDLDMPKQPSEKGE